MTAWSCLSWFRSVDLKMSESFCSRSLRVENHVGARTGMMGSVCIFSQLLREDEEEY